MEQRLRSPRAGFTLIELLIVVAIVAILALIAVPNYLEAQTRSKVAKAHDGLKQTGMAVELWRMDRNGYLSRHPFPPTVLPVLVHLTTPIAYVATVPEDPFAYGLRNTPHSPIDLTELYRQDGVWLSPRPFDYRFRSFNQPWETISSHPNQVKWALRSVGPDGLPTWLGMGAPAYDPTNGSVSSGDIYYTGPGIGFDQPSLVVQ